MNHPDGWIPLKDAAAEMGLFWGTLRKLAQQGKFTRLRKTPGRTAAVYLPRSEVEAFKAGGFAAVQKARRVKRVSP